MNLRTLILSLLIPFLINMTFGQSTIITPIIDCKIEDKNIIYVPTFEIAWSNLRNEMFGGESIEMDDAPKYLTDLNSFKYNKADYSHLKFIEFAGIVQEKDVDYLNRNTNKDFSSSIGKLISYSYLSYQFEYLVVFEKFNERLIMFDNQEVNTFGVSGYDPMGELSAGEMLKIYDYKSEDDFVIAIELLENENELILAKVNSEKTLGLTYASVDKRIFPNKFDTLDYNDVLKIPIIDFNKERNYIELLGKEFLNKCCKQLNLGMATQSIKFRMDQKGIKLESQTEIQVFCISKHNMIFDKPFLIILRNKKTRTPYFVGWIHNTEIMEKNN
jgi:hypothetical protein